MYCRHQLKKMTMVTTTAKKKIFTMSLTWIVDLNNITLNTEVLYLNSKGKALNSICCHGKISDTFDNKESVEEESEGKVPCLSVPRMQPQAKEDNMGERVQYIHLVYYPQQYCA
jgi:hypothetical protein